jgi:hypothetical protein
MCANMNLSRLTPNSDLRSANLSPERVDEAQLSPPSSPITEIQSTGSLSSLNDRGPEINTAEEHPQLLPPATSAQEVPVANNKFNFSIPRQITGAFTPNQRGLAPNYTGGMFTQSGPVKRVSNTFGSSPTCPRCGKAVYFAEQVRNQLISP